MASLFIIKGSDQGKRFELETSVISLGRDTDNHIQLQDTEVSRKHAEVRRDSGGYAVIDLKSSNGTYVNTELVRRRLLQNGDRVLVGRTLMIYTGPDHTTPEDMERVVTVIGHDHPEDDSQIIRSISQEESGTFFGGITESDSPWLARARSNLQVMYRTALAVSHTLDIDQLLNRILELIFEWVESDRGCIMLLDQANDNLEPKVHRNRQGVRDERMAISRRILDYVMENREGVLTSDARDDQRWDPGGSIVRAGVREAICVPMQGRYGIVGVIYIDTYSPPGRVIQQGTTRKFTEEHLKLMVAIAHQAALAVEDTSYYSAMVHAERLAAVGQTIATLSHHIKNILQGIRGGSFLIEEGLESDDRQIVRKGWAIVEKNQDKISNLVLDMLTFSKERVPELVPANLNQVVADVVELMQARARDARVTLVWAPDETMPEMTFDPDGLQRAVLNVITNAIDACDQMEDGKVAVSTRFLPAENMAHVIFADNGVGIPAEDLKKVFAIFESRKGSRGTGLGLPVSQKILQEHGGDIAVESKLGQGSQFTLQLPVVDPASEPGTTFVPLD